MTIIGYRIYDAFPNQELQKECIANLKSLGYAAKPLTADPVNMRYEGDTLHRTYPRLRYEVHVPLNSEL